MINFKTLPKLLAGDRCNFEGMDGDLLQNIVFKSFWSIFRPMRRVFQDTKVAWKVPVCFRDKLENYPSNPREIGQFSSFSPIFPLVPP